MLYFTQKTRPRVPRPPGGTRLQRLNTGMMARYDIEDRRPARVSAVQFGMGEALLGAVDRLIDAANAALAPQRRVGIACVQAGERGFARLLGEQDGLFTVLARGYRGEEAVRREIVVQPILQAVDPEESPEALDALAADPEIRLAILDADDPGAQVPAERFLSVRRAAGLPEPEWLCVGGGNVPEWLDGANAFPALADSLVFRSGAEEAAKLCADMNYADGMIHLAEPFARLTIRAGEDFRSCWPLDAAGGVMFADAAAFELSRTLRRRVFDAGLLLMGPAGWLNGCSTLRDCMGHERLRKFVGEAFMREILPALADEGIDRKTLETCAIESFERYDNPLNRSPILKSVSCALGRFSEALLPMLRRWAEQRFEPPRGVSFALAAAIMLYAGARRNPETGLYEVARGSAAEPLREDAAVLEAFSTLSHDMPAETLAYAALADRALWGGADLRDIDGLEERLTLDIAAMQRDPAYLPEWD